VQDAFHTSAALIRVFKSSGQCGHLRKYMVSRTPKNGDGRARLKWTIKQGVFWHIKAEGAKGISTKNIAVWKEDPAEVTLEVLTTEQNHQEYSSFYIGQNILKGALVTCGSSDCKFCSSLANQLLDSDQEISFKPQIRILSCNAHTIPYSEHPVQRWLLELIQQENFYHGL